MRDACSSACTGTILALLPLSCLTRTVHHSVTLEFDLPSYRTNAAQNRLIDRESVRPAKMIVVHQTQLRRGSWPGSYKVTAHRSRWLLMAILRMGRQIIFRAYAPVTEWVRPDPGWPMKYHRSFRCPGIYRTPLRRELRRDRPGGGDQTGDLRARAGFRRGHAATRQPDRHLDWGRHARTQRRSEPARMVQLNCHHSGLTPDEMRIPLIVA